MFLKDPIDLVNCTSRCILGQGEPFCDCDGPNPPKTQDSGVDCEQRCADGTGEPVCTCEDKPSDNSFLIQFDTKPNEEVGK